MSKHCDTSHASSPRCCTKISIGDNMSNSNTKEGNEEKRDVHNSSVSTSAGNAVQHAKVEGVFRPPEHVVVSFSTTPSLVTHSQQNAGSAFSDPLRAYRQGRFDAVLQAAAETEQAARQPNHPYSSYRRSNNKLVSCSASHVNGSGAAAAVVHREEVQRAKCTLSSNLSCSDEITLVHVGLAAGEELPPLIELLEDAFSQHDSYDRRFSPPSFSRGKHCGNVMEASRASPVHTSASFVPPSPSQSTIRKKLRGLVKAMLLFSAESSCASEAATRLFYSPGPQSVISGAAAASVANGGGRAGRSSATTTTTTTAGKGTSLFFASSRHRKLRTFLDEEATVRIARERWRDEGDWQGSLELLSMPLPLAVQGEAFANNEGDMCVSLRCKSSDVIGSLYSVGETETVDPTVYCCSPAALALRLEIHSRRRQWKEALTCLRALPPEVWTEMDVTGVVRAMYHAALEIHCAAARGEACGVGERKEVVGSRRTHKSEKHIKRAYITSSSSGENSFPFLQATILAKDGAATESLSESMLAVLAAADIHNVHFSSPAVVNDALGLLSLNSESYWQQACAIVDKTMLPPVTAASPPEGYEADAGSSMACQPLLRANAITVHHVCQALRTQWELALGYAQRLIEQHGISLLSDGPAVHSFLRVCVTGGRWQEAAALVQQQRHHLAHWQDGSDGTGANYGRQRAMMYRPDLVLSLMRLFSENHQVEASEGLLISMTMSKYYNSQTLWRAHNYLIQAARTAAEAERYLQALLDEAAAVPRRTAVDLGSSSTFPSTPDSSPIENESYAHLAKLHAVEGSWQQALHSLQVLLRDPRRQHLYVPTAQVHDAVQYALEQAPAPGPSWQVSLSLFMEMCEERHVSTSEVAFQSVVKRCFAQGARVQAQQLFQYIIRKGVRR